MIHSLKSYKITAMFFKLCSSSIYLFACVLAPSATWWLLCDTEVAKAKSIREKAKALEVEGSNTNISTSRYLHVGMLLQGKN